MDSTGISLDAASSPNPLDSMLSRLSVIEDAVSELKRELLRMREGDDCGSLARPLLRERASSESSCSIAPKLRTPTLSNTTISQKTGIHARDDTTGGTVYLGKNSVPAFILGQQQGGPKNFDRNGFDYDLSLQVFALHNSTVTYPFAHLWLSQVDVGDITQALPSNEDIMRYFFP